MLSRRRWDPHIHDQLQAHIQAHGHGSPDWASDRRPVAAFDWDNTAIYGDIGEATLQWLDALDGADRMGTYERMVEAEGKPVAYPWCAYAIAGHDPVSVRELAERVLEANLAAGRIRYRPEITDLIAALQRHGWDVWVVSASAEPLVQTAAQRYGVPADRVIGMRLATEDGRFVPRLAGPNTYREGKVEAIDRFVGRRPHLAAGDAETDLDMLDSGTRALLIDRGEPGLAERGRERGWWIQRKFEEGG